MGSETTNENTSASLARRRRKARLSRKNQDGDNKRPRDDSDDEEYFPEDVVSGEEPPRKKPHITGIKRQARYDPGVPMTREELTAWRKEARRVRNRESAAASRKRTRDRIEELEAKLSSMESKYAAALKRIVELEAAAATTSNDSVVPTTVSQSEGSTHQGLVSPMPSPRLTAQTVSPGHSPRESFSLQGSHEEQVEQKYQHIMDMISSTAA